MDKKHCSGCRNNFYNMNNPYKIKECFSLKTAKLVSRIPIGHFQRPPYLNKQEVLVPDCWSGEGLNRTHYIKPNALTPNGYWR